MAQGIVVVKKDELLEQANTVIENPANLGKVVITGVRAVNNSLSGKKDTLEFEFLQKRYLEGSNINVLGLLNQGDSRFNDGSARMRVWAPVTPKSAQAILGIPEETANMLLEAASKLQDDERIALMTVISQINTPIGKLGIKIVCHETTNKNALSDSIKEQLETQYRDRYVAQRYVKQADGTRVLEDAVEATTGKTVYRWFTLGTEKEADSLIPNKVAISKYDAEDSDALPSLGNLLTDLVG